MFNGFFDWVRRLFGRKPQAERGAVMAARAEADYRRVDEINFAYIFANKLANIAVSDATLNVTGPDGAESGPRAEVIAQALEQVFDKAHKITAQVLGSGGRVLVPYVSGGEVRFDAVAQERLYIIDADGERITAAAVLADSVEQNDKRYFRWACYTLEGDDLIVLNRATDEAGAAFPLTQFPAWADIPEEYSIAAVERLPLAFLRCPVDNRREKDAYGVPVTYGCEALIGEIREHLRLIAREYRLTRPMLGLSVEMWRDPFDGKKDKGIDRLRRTVQDSDDPFIPIEGAYDNSHTPWQVYAPAIRNEAMYDRLDRLFELLEKAVGTSRGILTARETAAATATEIRAANHDTFTLVNAVRRMWEQGLDDMAYAVDVLAEHFGLTPAGARGEYAVGVDWDMSLFESAQETFQQLSELQSRGMVSKAELRQWVRGGTLEEAQAAVDEIAAEHDTLSGIFAQNEDEDDGPPDRQRGVNGDADAEAT